MGKATLSQCVSSTIMLNTKPVVKRSMMGKALGRAPGKMRDEGKAQPQLTLLGKRMCKAQSTRIYKARDKTRDNGPQCEGKV